MKTVFWLLLLPVLVAGSPGSGRLESPEPDPGFQAVEFSGTATLSDLEFWRSCSYNGRRLPRGIRPREAQEFEEIRRIIRPFYETMCGNFVVLEVPGANGAFSYIENHRERKILYDPGFLRYIAAKTKSEYALVSVLAHEIGHHILQHFMRGGDPEKIELEADQWSGFFMGMLRRKKWEATEVMDKLFEQVQFDPDYPNASKRIGAIEKGFEQAEWLLTVKSVEKSSLAFEKMMKSDTSANALIGSVDFEAFNQLMQQGYWKSSFLLENITIPEKDLRIENNLFLQDELPDPEILQLHPLINEDNFLDMKKNYQWKEVIKREKFQEIIHNRELKNQ